jgi:16S rRNA (cytosine967-C5)-methyltransferase
VLEAENEVACAGFEAAQTGFERLDVESVLTALDVPTPKSATRSGYLRLWPHLHATDGFFAAIWRRH